jgi:hypothetical protein
MRDKPPLTNPHDSGIPERGECLERIELWCNLKEYAPGYARIGFGRVYHGTPEEQDFSAIFPGGESNFTVLMTRREAEMLEPQQRYWLDISRAMPSTDPQHPGEPRFTPK